MTVEDERASWSTSRRKLLSSKSGSCQPCSAYTLRAETSSCSAGTVDEGKAQSARRERDERNIPTGMWITSPERRPHARGCRSFDRTKLAS